MLSTRPVTTPPETADTVQATAAAPGEMLRRLEARGFRHLYIDGGKTIQGFRVPVLLGSRPVPQDVHLRHVETRSFSDGQVQSRYEVVR